MTENTVKNIEVETFGAESLKYRDYLADETSYINAANFPQTIPANNPIRPRMTTEELAALLRIKPQTVRAGLCNNGHYLGMRPAVKLPNRRLLWDAEQVAALING